MFSTLSTKDVILSKQILCPQHLYKSTLYCYSLFLMHNIHKRSILLVLHHSILYRTVFFEQYLTVEI